MKNKILAFFKAISPEAYHIEDAAYILGIKGADELETFMSQVKALAEAGLLVKRSGDYYKLTAPTSTAIVDKKQGNTVTGTYKSLRNGRGLVVDETGTHEVAIGPDDRNGAMHNDKVVAHIFRFGRVGEQRPEGRVEKIIEHVNTSIVGTYDRQRQFGFVTPDDERLGDDIYVALPDSLEARSGAKVLVEITAWPDAKGRQPEGKITQILGYTGDVGVDINCIMAAHKIPFAFPESVLDEAKQVNFEVAVTGKRLDLRDVPMITIDGEDAKDLDDAVSCKQLANGHYQLGVHIADVSHYVRGNTAIDKEAYKRGTSVYLVDRVVPMLPTVLSNGICSLNAKEDRYAMSCIMEINHAGKVVDFTISPSVIQVDRRCSYPEIYKALEEEIIPDDLLPLMPMVHELHEVAKILITMREKSGAISFEFPEYKILLANDGTPLKIVRKDRTIAEKIIEACMLIANETVAKYLRDSGKPAIYRIHEQPSEEKLQALQTVVTYLGKPFHLAEGAVEPKDIQQFLDSLAGTDVEQIAQIMTLRSMQQARYSSVNVGHFGLASACYTHFTSPIRRYPDLIVHRLLKKRLHWPDGYSKYDDSEEYLATAADHCSLQEQVAVAAERDTNDLKKVQYMEPYVGEVFDGKISSITSFGMFVELDNGIDGLVHIATMDDDYYFFDEEHFLLVGRRTGRTYHLGEAVKVTLIKADKDKKQIDFLLGEIDAATLIQKSLRSRNRLSGSSQFSSNRSISGKDRKRKSSSSAGKQKSRKKLARDSFGKVAKKTKAKKQGKKGSKSKKKGSKKK
ncbi:ribonuclease R [Veillonella sp. R32]|uniref:ribonuclease R n=1 Tax=Veillonella sp. R32 TaxID=2021312 RepID=UPI00138A1B4B|nr:ribonuclease R [Veillonella sp. R32]